LIGLVDTSVWVRFLAGRQPYKKQLETLLARGEVVGHPLVFGELLIGDRGGRSSLLADYQRMHQASVISHSDAVRFVRDSKLHGLGIGWVDAHLLASAMVDRLRTWTADALFHEIAQDLGVEYSP
jgi:predicted nucleic acid-binding protein